MKKLEKRQVPTQDLLTPAHCPLLPGPHLYTWPLDSVSLQSLWLQDQKKPQCEAPEGTVWSPLLESQVQERLV